MKIILRDAETLPTWLDGAQEAVNGLCRDFGFASSLTEQAVVELCGSVDAYLMATGKRREEWQSWMVGWSAEGGGRIALLLPGVVPEHTERAAWQVLVHELTHHVMDAALHVTDNEAWLAEGIAVLTAGQTELEYISEAACPLVADIAGKTIGGDAPDNFFDNGGYDYAGIYVVQLIAEHGREAFLRAYCNEIDPQNLIAPGFEQRAVRQALSGVKNEGE